MRSSLGYVVARRSVGRVAVSFGRCTLGGVGWRWSSSVVVSRSALFAEQHVRYYGHVNDDPDGPRVAEEIPF